MSNASVVLLILDRHIDLVPMLSHGWTYQALVHDCLDMKLNRVVVVRMFALRACIALTSLRWQQTLPQKRSYDLDSKDFFWAKNAVKPFPQVAEDIDTELNR
jgi:sec1 family domain-containing protein 1